MIDKLFSAITRNDFEAVSHILPKMSDINKTNCFKETPLIIASFIGNLPIVKLIIQQGGNLECKDDGMNTALLRAVGQGHLEVVRFLLEQGADVEARDDDGYTPLAIAILKRYINIARLLLQHGADIDAKDDDGETPLFNAVFFKHYNIVKLLLEYGADVEARDNYGQTSLAVALNRGYIKIAKLLLQYSADIEALDYYGESLLCDLCRNKENYNAIKFLLECGADVNYSNSFVMHLIDEVFSSEPCISIIERSCKSPFRKSALYYAHENKNTKIVKLLQKYGAT